MPSSITVNTDRQIAGLKAADRPHWVTVESCPGLRIKIAKGRKGTIRTFAYRHKKPDGGQELKMIGRYAPPHFGLAEARAKWRELRAVAETHGYVKEVLKQARAANIAELQSTAAQSERDGYSVRAMAREYIDYQSARIKTWSKTAANLEVYVLPVLGSRPAHAVQRTDVVGVLDSLTARGLVVTSNRVLAAVRAMYNWGLDRDKVDANPCGRVKPQKEAARERMLGDVELRRLFANLSETTLNTDKRDLLEFILLTGCRLSEAAQAPLDEFDIDAALWILPKSRSKNGREHRLPLSVQALALIERRRGASAYLFQMGSNDKRPMRAGHVHTSLREAIPALKVLPFTPHDLRRSTASGLAALGAPRDIVRRLLNHTDPTVTARYDRHDYTADMRVWLQKWADHLDELRGTAKPSKGRASK